MSSIKTDVGKIDFSKIATSASNARNGSFLNVNSINTDCWGDSTNNIVEVELVDSDNNVYLISENGNALGFTTGNFLEEQESSQPESVDVVTEVVTESVDLSSEAPNSVQEVSDIIYDEDGNRVDSIYDENGNLLYTITTIEGDNGSYIQVIKNTDMTSIKNYYNTVNGKSVLTKSISYNADGKEVLQKIFYESGNVSSLKVINEDGSYSVKSFDDNDSGIYTETRFYDINGNFEMLKKHSISGDYHLISVYDNVSGSGTPISAVKYDQSWGKVSDIEYLDDGGYSEVVSYKDGVFKSIYDKDGNMYKGDYIVDNVLKNSYEYSNGNIVSKSEYYGDNGSSKVRYSSSGSVISFILKDGSGNNVVSLNGEGKWGSYNGYVYFINGFGTLSCHPISSFNAANDGSSKYYMVSEIDGVKYVTVTTYDGESTGDIVGYYSVSDARKLGILPSTLDSVPLYDQYASYDYRFPDGDTIGRSGCGFCSMAMVTSYLTGDSSITPVTLAQKYADGYAYNTYYGDGGMQHSFPPKVAEDYGFSCKLTSDINEVVSALKNGSVAVSSQGPGIFTSSGHIITLAGVDNNGNIIVNNPSGSVASYSASQVNASASKYWVFSN